MAIKPCSDYVNSAEGTYSCPGLSQCPMANRGCWGTASEGVFTADSSPCRAARCAGVISDGGVFTLSSCAGRPSYEGGTKNGVTISGWGDYPLSFTVMGASSYSRPEPEKPKHLDCDKYVKDTCSGVYLCAGGTCPMAGRSVWGGIDNGGKFYTGDSSPCAAARAEGVISGGGGVFRLVACGDRPTMDGFSSNGIEVRKWGSYANCFRVKSHTAGVGGHDLEPPPKDECVKLQRKFD